MAYWGMLIRPAEPEDALAVAQVHVRSWQAAYRTLLPDDYLDQLRAENRAEKYDFTGVDPLKPRTIVAAEDGLIYKNGPPHKDGQIYGFATTAPSRDQDLPDYGELCALYVDPGQWGLGIGKALVSAARAELFEAGFRNAFLWVMVGNVRAERFYQIDGWTPDGLRRTDTVWGVTVEEVRYRRDIAAT